MSDSIDTNPDAYPSDDTLANKSIGVVDDLGGTASHDRAQGTGPGKVTGGAFSHANDPDAHPDTRQTESADEHSQEALESGTIAEHTGSGKFKESLEQAIASQEESGTTTS